MEIKDYNDIVNAISLIVQDEKTSKITVFYNKGKVIMRAKQRIYKSDKGKRRKYDPIEILITLGKPNYREKEVYKRIQKHGDIPETYTWIVRRK